MLGRQHGYITSQGLILADHFAEIGYRVLTASTAINRYVRLVDIVATLLRNRGKIDIQCLEVYGGPSFVVEDIASSVGKFLGQRVVMVLHGGALPEFIARYPRWTRRVLSRADVIVVPSPYLARAIAPHGFKAQIIPNVINLNDYEYRHRDRVSPRLLWMRSFHYIYNPLKAVQILAQVRRSVPEATLVMAGADKGMQAAVMEEAKSLGLNGAVRFPGFLDKVAKMREGSNADIFINTSTVDNMPVALIEACAMGLPVVTTAVGGIPDLLVDGETALITPSEDDESIVSAIHKLLNEPEMAGRLSTNGRKVAERSSWEQVRLQWEQLFSELKPQNPVTEG